MPRSKWTCPKCRALNQRTSSRKCLTCEGLTKPKRRVPAHAVTLRDHNHAHYAAINELIHGAGDTCGVCRKPPTDARNLDRDHDHVTGLPRGLACPGNQGCNALMPRQMTLERARAIVAYLERVEAHYSQVSE